MRLLITIAISTVMWGAAKDVFARLLDAVAPELVDAGRKALAETPGVRSVDDLRLRWSEHRLLADAVVKVDSHLTLVESHEVAHRAEESMNRALPRLASSVIHAHPDMTQAETEASEART